MAYRSPLTGTKFEDIRKDAQKEQSNVRSNNNSDSRDRRPAAADLVTVPDRRGLRRQAGDTLK